LYLRLSLYKGNNLLFLGATGIQEKCTRAGRQRALAESNRINSTVAKRTSILLLRFARLFLFFFFDIRIYAIRLTQTFHASGILGHTLACRQLPQDMDILRLTVFAGFN
jgi:hypothetical protein